MKKLAGLAAVGVGALAFAGAGASQAAETHISGNLQYTSMQYWCDHGTPNFAFGYRTLNQTEASVIFTATGFRPLEVTNVKPYYASEMVRAATPRANRAVTVSARGTTTGSHFSVSGKTPATCAGLPNKAPMMDWSAEGRPTAKPTTPAPTKPAPTKPAPTKPAPTKPAPTKPAPTTPAPTTTGQGPKVETDRVVTNQNNTTAAAAGLGALVLAGGGLVVARRARR